MSSDTSLRRQIESPEGLCISPYDRVAGMIVALLVIVGFGVTVLVLLWLAGRAMAGNEQPPVELLAEDFAAGTDNLGTQQELVEPGVEEFADVEAPQLADTLAAVTTAISTQAATLDEMFGASSETGSGAGQGSPHGAGGNGDRDVVPRGQRFKLQLASTGARQHARVLDFFQIEIALLGGGVDGITYVSKFNHEKPQVRQGHGDEEQRLYFVQDSHLADLDRQLLSRAGIDGGRRVIVYFVPQSLESTLARLEQARAGQRPLEEIQHTVFGVQSAGDGYEFFVIDQEYRPRP